MNWPEDFVNKIICGDCLSVMKEMPDKCVGLIVTDPPYEFINKSPQGGGFMINSNKKHFERIFNSFGMSFNPIEFLKEIKRLMKKINCYIFTNRNLLYEYISFAKENNYIYEIMVWLKPNPVPCNKNHYLHDKEYCVFLREKSVYFNSNLGYENYFTYFIYPIGKKTTQHPTEKPLNLIRQYIKISSKDNNIILDPFLGSGTTAVACKLLHRNFIGIEINPEYCKIAEERLAQGVL